MRLLPPYYANTQHTHLMKSFICLTERSSTDGQEHLRTATSSAALSRRRPLPPPPLGTHEGVDIPHAAAGVEDHLRHATGRRRRACALSFCARAGGEQKLTAVTIKLGFVLTRIKSAAAVAAAAAATGEGESNSPRGVSFQPLEKCVVARYTTNSPVSPPPPPGTKQPIANRKG